MKSPLMIQNGTSLPPQQKTAYYSHCAFLSHWRTGNFLFLPRNGLSYSVTTCSVPQERKEDRERARLDSMVLLIMKLDQLDQDIENALSTSSSPSSTPTNLRRHVPVSLPLSPSLPWPIQLLCAWNPSDGSVYPPVTLVVPHNAHSSSSVLQRSVWFKRKWLLLVRQERGSPWEIMLPSDQILFFARVY